MKLISALYTLTLLPLATPLSLPELNLRHAVPIPELPSRPIMSRHDNEIYYSALEKRRGGGGGGGGGRGGSTGSSGSSGSTGSSGSSGSSSSGGSSGLGGSSGSTGGSRGTSSSGFSSSSPTYSGGRSYAGGASTPYSAGRRTPSGILPLAIGAGAITFFGAAWLYGAYSYPYTHPYYYHNTTTNQNETLPVTCYCQQYSACGCDNTDNSTQISDVLQNSTVAKIVTVNGTREVAIDGTLPNGTDPNSDSGDTSGSLGLGQLAREASGFWAVGAIVGLIVWGL